MHRNMRFVPALSVVLAILAACFIPRDGASGSHGGIEAQAIHASQPTAVPLVPASEPVKVGCKRGLPGVTPAPCSAGFALLAQVPQAWMQTGTAGVSASWARWMKPIRPKGLLDPPRPA